MTRGDRVRLTRHSTDHIVPLGPDPASRFETARTVLVASAACGGAAVAWWLLPASVHIVEWPASGPARIALFAPLARLWLATCAAAAAAAIVLFAGGRDHAARAARLRIVAPLALLWLWTVPYWPWLPDRAPVLLALAGPARWLVAAASAAGVAAAWARTRRRPSRPASAASPGLARTAIFLVSLATYVWLGQRSLASIGLLGDEPHYLIIAHSLLVDRDLRIENNHAREDYRSFFPGTLRPDYLRRGVDGEIYSIHAPGLPALLLPAYAMAGARGAVLAMCLLGALAALAVFDVASLVGGVPVGVLTWASVCLTVPWIPHAWSIYPEMAGAAIVAWTVVWLLGPVPPRAWPWIGRGACLAVLPWLHTKFVVFLAILAAYLFLRIVTSGIRPPARRYRSAAAFAAPIAVSVAAWLAFFYVIYGTPNPEAPYGTYTDWAVQIQNIPRSILGVLLDQKFGLLVYSPVYLFTAVGGWQLVRERATRRWASALTLASVLFIASSGRMYMWWGGASAPARFLVPVLPLWAPLVASALARTRHIAMRAAMTSSIAFSLLVAAIGVLAPDRLLLFSEPHGIARILDVVQGSAPLAAAWPTFTDENWWLPAARLAPWLGAAVVALAGAMVAARGRRARVFWIAALEAGAFLAAGAVLVGSFPAAVRADSSRRGRIDLLEAFDPGRLRAFDYPSRTKVDAARLLASAVVTIPLRADEPVDELGRLAGPLSLPPGRYQARVWFEGERPRAGDLVISLGNDVVVARATGPLPNPATVAFDLPVRLPSFWVMTPNLTTARAAARVELAPLAVVPAGGREDRRALAWEPLANPAGAYLAYMDRHSYPEGGVFWTRGTEAADVVAVTAGASRLDLVLHVGPNEGVMGLTVAGQPHDTPLKANETLRLSFDVPAGATEVPIRVQAPRSFRPIDAEPGSTDTRTLGCQVRPELR